MHFYGPYEKNSQVMPIVQIFRISGDTLNSTAVKHIFVTIY